MLVSKTEQIGLQHQTKAGLSPRSGKPAGVPDAGRRLREIREQCRLKYRDVEDASQWIANQHGSHAFLVGISRLADIENKGTTPSLFRLYSLCAIYRIEYAKALGWYGIELDHLPAEAAHFGATRTQSFDLETPEKTSIDFPVEYSASFDFKNTDHLSRSVKAWGKLPLALLNGLDITKKRYAFIGTDDWSMYPIIRPGSFLELDEKRRKIARDGWTSEHDRPIYFLEHRQGFRCGWCSLDGSHLVVQPHYSSLEPVAIFQYPGEVDVIGQVTAVIMRLDQGRKRHTHS